MWQQKAKTPPTKVPHLLNIYAQAAHSGRLRDNCLPNWLWGIGATLPGEKVYMLGALELSK